ncbi:MAG: BrnT family toxin [Campylobacterales bacterium]|nr:BrnT family toxin [Campylobacterales bacterium]
MKFDCLDIAACVGFDWDKGNIYKNENKHGIKWQDIEEIFFNDPLLLLEDIKHSSDECRCFALGKTDEALKLFVVFTKRERKIRVISARMMNKKEMMYYENYQ